MSFVDSVTAGTPGRMSPARRQHDGRNVNRGNRDFMEPGQNLVGFDQLFDDGNGFSRGHGQQPVVPGAQGCNAAEPVALRSVDNGDIRHNRGNDNIFSPRIGVFDRFQVRPDTHVIRA